MLIEGARRRVLAATAAIEANIMSLGGVAIAIGAMVDAAIVMIENAHKHLERAPPLPPTASCRRQ